MYTELPPTGMTGNRLIVHTKDFNMRFGQSESWLFAEDLTFAWTGALRMAIRGRNGSGKSTLLKALVGIEQQTETRGELQRGRVQWLYLDQRCEILNPELSVLENIREISTDDESELRNALARFQFQKDKVHQQVSSLSGGERFRAALAKGLLGTDAPDGIALDEPTNNMDLANIEFLEGFLRSYLGAVILVSHDDVFLERAGVGEALVL